MVISDRLLERIATILRRQIQSGADLAHLLNRVRSVHLTTDDFAAFVEHAGDLRSAGHLLSCRSCRERAEAAVDIDGVEPFAGGIDNAHRRNFIEYTLNESFPSAFATLHIQSADCWIESNMGHRAEHPVLQVRGDREQTLTLRDAADHPSFETRVTLTPNQRTFDLQTRWLTHTSTAEKVCVQQGSKTVATVPLKDGTARVSSLRVRDSTIWFESDSGPTGLITLFVESRYA